MRLVDLVLLYAIVGVACAIAIYRASPSRGARAMIVAAATIPIWPLWAPIALTVQRPRPRRAANDARASARTPAAAAAARVAKAIDEGVSACAGSSLEPLLSREAGDRIAAEVARAAGRLAEIDATLARPELDRDAATARLAELELQRASPRAIATAKLHLDNIDRLRAMRDRDARAIAELADLVQALTAQLALAKFAGSSSREGASGIVSEVWARVEGLGDALGESDAMDRFEAAAGSE